MPHSLLDFNVEIVSLIIVSEVAVGVFMFYVTISA